MDSHSPALRTNSWLKLQAAFRKIDVKIPSLSSVILSLLGLALMSYLTVRDFIPLLREYKYNNQDTNVRVIPLDPNFTVPEISLTIPHYKFYKPLSYTLFSPMHQIFPIESDCFYKTAANLKRGGIQINSEILKVLLEEYRNESDLTFYNAFTLKLVEMVLENGANDLNDILRSFPSACRKLKPYPESKISWRGIFGQAETNGAIMDYDQSDSGFQGISQNSILPYPLFVASFNFLIHQYRSDYYFAPAEWGSTKLSVMHSKLMKSPRVKLETLFAMVLKTICQQTKFSEQEFAYEFDTGHDVNRTCEDLFVGSKRTVFPDYMGIGFTIQNGDHSPKIEEYKFEFALHELSIWASSKEHEPNDAMTANLNRRFVTYADASVQYLSRLDHSYASYIYQTPPISWGNDTYGRKITIKYSVQNRARKTRDPTERRDLCFAVAQCRLMCTKNKLIDGPCGCVPFAFRRGLEYSNSTPFCDAESYAACSVNETWDTTMAECVETCQDFCNYTSYTFQIEFEQFELKTPHVREFILKTIPIFSSFTEFTWRKKTTEEQFFAQLAGIAGLYLGFSGLSVIAGLAWIIDWMIGRWKRKGREATDMATDNSVLLEKRNKELMEFMKDMEIRLETRLKSEWKRDLDNAVAKF